LLAATPATASRCSRGKVKPSGDQKMPTPILESWPRRRHHTSRGNERPQGGRAAHQGDSEPHARPRHDRWREPPRPPHASFYGAGHDRSGIPRGQASQGSLDSQRYFSMQVIASLSGVARCCVDPDALEWGHRLFLALWERGYAESCVRTSENSPSKHWGA
jgi:hypothetical protein